MTANDAHDANVGAPAALKPTDDVIVHAYHLAPEGLRAQRPDDDGQLLPFLRGRKAAFRFRDDDALLAHPLFKEHGAFVVLDVDALLPQPSSYAPSYARTSTAAEAPGLRKLRENATHKKRMFIVFPRWHDLPGVMTGDHFTFLVNHKSGVLDPLDRKPVKFHVTMYPHEDQLGFDQRDIKNYLPLQFPLGPLDDFRSSPLLTERLAGSDSYASAIHAVLTRPFQEGAATAATVTGGGIQRRRRTGRERAADWRRHQDQASPPSFADLWRTLPLQMLHLIGVRRGDVYHFTVSARPRVPHRPGTLTPAATFEVRGVAAARDPGRVEAEATRVMSEWMWEDFTAHDDSA